MRTQLFGTEAAVEADRQRPGMAHGVPERLHGMARQIAARKVGQRQRDHQRYVAVKFARQLLHRHDSGLAVERVEHRLDEDEIGPASDKRAALFDIDGDDFVECHFAKPWVFDIGRKRQRLVGRPDSARHEPRNAVVPRIDRFTDDPRRGDIDLMDQVFGAVIGLADAIGVEGVGGEDMRARIDVAVTDPADHLRLRQIDEVVIALLLLREIGARGIVFGR